MAVPWTSHGILMEVSRKSYGSPMGLPGDFEIPGCFRGAPIWDFHWTSKSPWKFRVGILSSHVASVVFPWDFHESSVGLRSSYDTFVVLPWGFHRNYMSLPSSHEASVVFPLEFYGTNGGTHVGVQSSCGASAVFSWHFHGTSVGFLSSHQGSVVIP